MKTTTDSRYDATAHRLSTASDKSAPLRGSHVAASYPLDVGDLLARVKKRGDEFVAHLGLAESLREDVALTRLAWGASRWWFPVAQDGAWHGAVDLGLADAAGDSLRGAPVTAVAEGEVVFVDDYSESAEGYDFKRVIVRTPTPDGDAYVLYQHLGTVEALAPGKLVAAGERLGSVGWHGDFPHLHLAVASQAALGGDKDLVPEAEKSALPEGAGVWNVLRVRVGELVAAEWPGLPNGDWYVFNPIEFVRWLRGEAYQHDIGAGTSHALTCSVTTSDLGEAGQGAVHKVDVALKCSALKGCDGAQKLARDPGFAPLTMGEGDQTLIECVQRALKSAGYDLGRFGKKRDGVDGAFGETMKAVLQKFQDDKLATLDLSALGKSAADVKRGQLDWLTLVALDLFVAGLEAKSATPPAVQQPEPTRAPPERPKEEERAAKLTTASYVFDASSKEPSLQFGMRMYKALLDWELAKDGAQGVRYSSASASFKPYQTNVAAALKPEWPNLEGLVEPTTTKVVGGKTYNVYKAFGVTWIGTHSTNCCNSQMAAMFVALGDGVVHIKGADGKVVDHDARKSTTKVKVATKPGGKALNYPLLAVFEQTFVNGQPYYDESGKALQRTAGMNDAVEFLGIGAPLGTGKFSTDQAQLKLARVGDLASYSHHAWMVGDVRYGVWFKDGKGDKKKPDACVDQSGFVDDAAPKLTAGGGERLLSSGDCDWIASHETEFHGRIDAFLKVDKLDWKGASHDVDRVDVTNIRVFSANCIWAKSTKTADGKVYTGSDDAGWVYDARKTSANASRLGISRPWSRNVTDEPIVFARLFKPAS